MNDTPGIEEELKTRLSEIVNKDLSKRQVEKIVELFAPDKWNTITDEEIEQEFKEIHQYLTDTWDYYVNNNGKDAGHLCIAFNDKINGFKRRLLAGYKANPLHRVVDEHFEHNLFMMNADVWTNEHDWTMTIDKFKKCLSEYASKFKHSLPVNDESKVTRVEVVDDKGRSYTNWDDKNKVELSYQDNGRTLKIFITQ